MRTFRARMIGFMAATLVLAAALLLPAPARAGDAPAALPPPVEWTFAQLCDPQLGMGGYEQDVQRLELAVRRLNELKPDFVLICGDLVSQADEKSYADLKRILGALTMPWHGAPGNHDVGNAPTTATLELFRKNVGPDRLAFEHKGFLILLTDTSLWKVAVPDESEKHDAWVRETLAAGAKKGLHAVVAQHFPLFIDTPDEKEDYFNLPLAKRTELLALFPQSGVAAVLSGHVHRTITREYQGMQLVSGETTSRNFDNRPPGFRLWHAGGTALRHEFVPLEPAPAAPQAPQ